MTLRFVKTSVLSSTDGIDFSNEVAVESEEAKMARLAAERASQKSLFDQLSEQRQKKQDEYDANTKLMFAPPKAIDEEEFAFLKGMEDRRQDIEKRRKEEEDRELERFRLVSKKSEPPPRPVVAVIKPDLSAKKSQTMNVPSIIRVKRKADNSAGDSNSKEMKSNDSKAKASQSSSCTGETVSSNEKKSAIGQDVQPLQSTAAGIVGLFSDYGSDEDQDSEHD
eukprot:gene27148-32794_t